MYSVYSSAVRIAYVNHGRFPTEKAYGFQIAQMCEAMMALGHEVTLICPAVRNAIRESPRQYYGLRSGPRIVLLPARNFLSPLVPGFLRFAYSMWPYGNAVRDFVRGEKFDLLYIRSPFLLRAAIDTRIPVILELHALPRFLRGRFVTLCHHCKNVVCLTGPMRDELMSWGVDAGKIIAEADGVDLRRFGTLPSSEAAKARWHLPHDRPVVGYVGSLVTRETLEKGVRKLIDAMQNGEWKMENTTRYKPFLWIVGGPQQWIDTYRAHAASIGLSAEDVRFQGFVNAADVPSAIAACDICVYPAPKSDHPYFLRDTSPLKLFEYLAAGRPVVCADLPPIRDIVDEKSVRFFKPGDSEDLATAIDDVLAHPEEARRRAEEGRRIAEKHSWEERMRRILPSSFAPLPPSPSGYGGQAG